MGDEIEYNVKAIPTVYGGTTYRSRLEARWAAMFEMLKWPYIYEPCEFNGWYPDFLLNLARPVYVEVKPVTDFPKKVAERIDRSGCPNEVMIVGLAVGFGQDVYNDPHEIGWLREGFPAADTDGGLVYDALGQVVYESWWWEPAVAGIWKGRESEEKNPEQIIGFCHKYQSYVDRVTGCYDGGCYGQGSGYRLDHKIQGLWNVAGSIVQITVKGNKPWEHMD